MQGGGISGADSYGGHCGDDRSGSEGVFREIGEGDILLIFKTGMLFLC